MFPVLRFETEHSRPCGISKKNSLQRRICVILVDFFGNFSIIKNMEEFKEFLSSNLTYLRKKQKLTQSEFAKQLNYSDKTISKWEKGIALPDVETLVQISKFYGVSIDKLLNEKITEEQNTPTKVRKQIRLNKLAITLLSVITVWFVAIVIYAELLINQNINYWLIFIWAIPISSILLLIFNSIWGKRFYTFLTITALVWSLLLGLHLQLVLTGVNAWPIYLIGIPTQIAIILTSQIRGRNKKFDI